MKKGLTVLAVLVAAALVVSGFAVPSMAAESAEPATQTDAVSIVREDESLRGEYEKHFLMSDGTYQAVVYSEPVHTMVDGVWVETDNVMTADADTGTDSDRMNILDNYVMKGSGVQNNNLDRLYIGTKSGCLCRGFIQFKTMPTIPEGSTITAATMTLDILDGTAVARNASVFMVEEAWVSGELQWSNQPDATVPVAENISHNEQTKYVFSCVDAVRHWYDGDSTGMNENYGIMVRYYDETLINYNSIYSADCAYESKRPVIAITYEDPSVSVLEGYTKPLSVTGATGTVTWSSSNTAAATVDSSGVVTGIKAGRTVVTASVDGEAYQTFTVYVKIQDGVYYIENLTTGLYLGTYGGVAENTVTTLFSKATSDRAQLNQLWKITYLDSGYYSIRPMYMLSMGLHATSNVVDIKTIQTDDSTSGVPLVSRWGIEHGEDGYKFTHVGTSSLTMKATASYSDYVISTEVYSSSETGFLWDLERVTDLPNQVLLIDTQTGTSAEGVTRYVAPGETATLTDLGIIATFVSVHDPDYSVEWDTLHPSVIFVDPETGSITGLTAGETGTIVAKHIYNGIVHEACFTICVPLISNGTYFIRNNYSANYVDIADGLMQNGTEIMQWDFEGDNTQKWTFTHLGDGTYSIESTNSGVSYYLGVSGDSTEKEQPVVLRTGSLTMGMKWIVGSTTNGAYRLTPLTGIDGDYALSIPSGVNGLYSGETLYQDDYSSYHDTWHLCAEKDYTLMLLGASTNDPLMPPILDSVENVLMNDAQMSGYANTTMTTVEAIENMASSRFFACITHGSPTYIRTSNGTFSISDLDLIPDSAFSDLEFVYLGACYTGYSENGENCFAQTIYDKGVNTVIAYKSNARIVATNYWAEQFMLSLADGNTIEDALAIADKALKDHPAISDDDANTILADNRYIQGPTNVAPCD